MLYSRRYETTSLLIVLINTVTGIIYYLYIIFFIYIIYTGCSVSNMCALLLNAFSFVQLLLLKLEF